MSLMRIVLLLFSCLVSMTSISFANEEKQESKENLRYYVGGKLGYSGISVNGLENKTLKKDGSPNPANKQSLFFSTFGLGVVGGLQYDILPVLKLRAELEYLHRVESKHNSQNGYQGYKFPLQANATIEDLVGNTRFSLSSHTILANAYLDYYVTPRVALYAGIGLGVSLLGVELDAASADYDDFLPEPDTEKVIANFAWQAGIGTRFLITQNVIFDINLRYVGLAVSDTTVGNPLLTMKYGMVGAVDALVGVTYLF